MLTLKADAQPLMSRMHKPDPELAADKQDKRSVIPRELADVDLWLTGTTGGEEPAEIDADRDVHGGAHHLSSQSGRRTGSGRLDAMVGHLPACDSSTDRLDANETYDKRI